MRVFITDSEEDSARELMQEEDMLFTTAELLQGQKSIPEGTKTLVLVFAIEKGNTSIDMQKLLKTTLKERDNTALEYAAAVGITPKRDFLARYIVERLLYEAGIALPYSVVKKEGERLNEVKADLEKEEIVVHGRLPLSRFISRFLIRK